MYIGFMPLPIFVALLALQTPQYHVKATDAPQKSVTRIERALEQGDSIVRKYFGKPFPKSFDVVIAASRKEFDVVAGRRWKMPASDRWMVGAGGSDILLLLAPDRWKGEADEHDGESDKELNDIVAHELVHVYHSQVCPNHEFDGMDDVAWFIEGLAVRVSGQLESSHRGVAQKAIIEGTAPKTLEAAWSGKHRYGIAGSMARFVETTWGKATVLDLLKATSNSEALNRLKTTEDRFLRDWRAWVERGGRKGQPHHSK